MGTAGEIRVRVNKSIRQNKVAMWFCGAQSVIGAVWVIGSGGASVTAWAWLVGGFVFLFVYAGLLTANLYTLTLLEGIPDEE